MTTHSRSNSTHSSIATVVLAMALAGMVATGCATQGAAAPALTNDASAPVYVEVSARSITIQNRTGGPLVNMSIVLLPAQGSPFTKIVPRVEDQQRHELAMADLKTSQGTAFDPATAEPRALLVSATNVAGERFEAKVPWQ